MANRHNEAMENAFRRSPALAGLLSLLAPGLGQLYAGHPVAAAVFGFLSLTVVMAGRSPLVFLGGFPFFVSLFVAGAVAHVAGVLHAAWLARRRPAGPQAFQRAAVYGGYYAFLSILAGVFVFLGPVQTYLIPASSMAPGLMPGDRLVGDKSAFRAADPKLGDVVIFRYPRDPRITYIKRVAGVTGDTIEFKDGSFFRNGAEVPASPSEVAIEDSVAKEDGSLAVPFREKLGDVEYTILRCGNCKPAPVAPTQVLANQFFFLCDNRDRSSDSRFWGAVDRELVIGRPAFVWFSRDPASGRIRWDRVGIKL